MHKLSLCPLVSTGRDSCVQNTTKTGLKMIIDLPDLTFKKLWDEAEAQGVSVKTHIRNLLNQHTQDTQDVHEKENNINDLSRDTIEK